MLNWVNRFNIFCFLDSHHYTSSHSSVNCLLAAGSIAQITCEAGTALDQLSAFRRQHRDWVFGHLGYDLKNEMEAHQSNHPDFIQFPDLFFFVPDCIVKIEKDALSISSISQKPESIFREIIECSDTIGGTSAKAHIRNRFNRLEYIDVVNKLKQHILRGDCYEINFCQEFFDDSIHIDPLKVFSSLGKTSPNPFAAYYRVNDKYLLCASPERYLKKTAGDIYSQPIKGTSQRYLSDHFMDSESRKWLSQSQKDRSENVMVVDLVRNDLSKICVEGSVEVEELFGIYSFPQVHQMISTVKGIVPAGVQPEDIIRASFPMGSMTGAPKKRVMDLIEKYERTKRGLFSGSVGYIDPNDDFDFNVVIRSIFYNQSNRYLSFQAGSGITFYSDPKKEYEECLLKAEAIKKVLTA